mmetsp:Transcript_76131/g.176600  ORF Transcript_76131/g.176600 Transcript_76131/m.176600 type:complete len:408 (-) Transcript_76131:266-1489(-)
MRAASSREPWRVQRTGALSELDDSSTKPSRAKALALATEIMDLQERHEEVLEEFRSRIKELENQVDALSAQNLELEGELAGVRQPPGQRQPAVPLQTLESMDTDNNLLAGTDEASVLETAEPSILEEKGQFIRFVLKVAEGGTDTKEYKQLYLFLLKRFTDADSNFDGRVGYLEFETLIDAAAFLPRRFGYAPSIPELYGNDFDRVRQRLALFNGLKPKKAKSLDKKSGTYDYIGFDAWLRYAVSHIREKAALLKNEKPHSKLLSSKEEFQEFVLEAVRSRKSREYKEFYAYVLKCFVDADKDMDGLLDANDFNVLLEVASVPPRKFGFAPETSKMYASEADKLEARTKVFNDLDKEGSGYVGFDACLEYVYQHICEKSASLGSEGVVPEIEAAGPALSQRQCPWHV